MVTVSPLPGESGLAAQGGGLPEVVLGGGGGESLAAVMLAPYFPAGNTGTASIPSCPPALPGGSSSSSTGIGIQGGVGLLLPITLMLSLGAGVTVSLTAGKYVFKDSAGNVVLEAGADEVDEIRTQIKRQAQNGSDALEGGSYASPNKVDSLLDGRPELTGSTRDKLLATVQDPELSKIVNELYRPGATVGDGGTAAILVEEFSKGSSTHLLKATERLKQLKKLASSGKLGLNDLDVVEALIDDLESAISLYN